VDQRPAAVVLPENAHDVANAVQFAQAYGERIAPQRTGHNADPLESLTGTILLRTDRMRRVETDPQRRIARAEAGVLWTEVVRAAARHGLAGLQGSSPDVGVVGYTIGGGMSFLGRKFGLASNHVHAIEVVTADGRVRRVDREQRARPVLGPCAAAVAASGSSRRSSSSCSSCPRSMPCALVPDPARR
jgi:FAD/FMN-containing dehydrogenase